MLMPFRNIHVHNAELDIVGEGAVDGAKVILSEEREKVAADIEFRKSSYNFAVFYQIGNLNGCGKMSFWRYIAAACKNNINCFAGNNLLKLLCRGLHIKACQVRIRYAVIGSAGGAGGGETKLSG